MDLAPLFLLLLLPPSDATGELASAIEGSLHSELGDVAMAMVPDRLVTPAMLEGDNPPYRARFVAHVTWAGRDKVSIEVHSGREAKTGTPYRASRVVTFSSQDRKAERGRAIGLVMAGLLRDSPPSVFGAATAPPPPTPGPPHRGPSFGALVSVERTRAATWPVGPIFFFTWPLADKLDLRISAGVLAADDDWQLPMAVEARWRFLRSQDNRKALALGMGLIVQRESVSRKGDDDGGHASLWNVGGLTSVSGYVTLGQSLRLLAQVELHALARQLTIHSDEEHATTTTFSRWRPAFGVGLAYSL